MLRPGEKPFRGKDSKNDLIKYLKIAKIIRVDYETGYVDIEWVESHKAKRAFIRLPTSYSSLRSCIRGMPEIGSLVVCGWIRGQSHTWEDPIILSFLDFNLDTFHNYSLTRTQKTPEQLKQVNTIREKIGYDITRVKRRKIYPGEIQIESAQGAELYLDDDIYLSNSKLNEIEIRSADQSIRISSNQIYSVTQSARTWQGMVIREISNSFVYQPTVLPNGQKIQIVTDSHNPIHLGGKAFTENRIEIFEKSDGILKVSEVNSGKDISDQTPFITFLMGTLVGNDKVDCSKYAKVLRPQIYGTSTATDASLDHLEVSPEDYDHLASCFHLKFNKSRSQIDIDKEGHLFTFFSSSSNRHPLGAGRSWESYFEGSVKMVIGAENTDNNSLILDTKGAIRATLGSDKHGRSAFIVAQKGMHLEVMAPADDGIAYYLKTRGNYQGTIEGDYNLNVSGNYKVTVKGKIQEQILGVKEENYVNDKNNVYGGSLNSVIIKSENLTIGYNRVVNISGNLERGIGIFTPATINEIVDKLEILLGGKQTTLWIGNINEEIKTTGDIKRTITLKNTVGFSDSIMTGNHEINVSAKGDIKRHVLLKDTVGISDTVDTGNHETDITIKGDIKRNVTLKDAVGIADSVITGNIEQTVTLGDIKRTVTTKDSVGMSDTIVNGDHVIDITNGNIEQNIITGDVTTNVSVGDINEAIVTGSKSVEIQAGDFTVKISAGNIDIKTLAGNVKLNSVTQQVTISGMLLVKLESGVKIEAKAPSVNLGPLPVMGGVVTGLPAPSMLCYLSGTPLLCSQTVRASL